MQYFFVRKRLFFKSILSDNQRSGQIAPADITPVFVKRKIVFCDIPALIMKVFVINDNVAIILDMNVAKIPPLSSLNNVLCINFPP